MRKLLNINALTVLSNSYLIFLIWHIYNFSDSRLLELVHDFGVYVAIFFTVNLGVDIVKLLFDMYISNNMKKELRDHLES